MQTITWSLISEAARAAHVARAWKRHGECIEEHDHDFAEIFLVLSGCGVHLVHGNEHPLTPGTAALIRPETRHSMVSIDGLEYINVAFEAYVLNELYTRYAGLPDRMYHHLPGTATQYLGGLALELGHDDGSPLRRDFFLLAFFREAANNDPDQRFDLCPDWLRQACRQLSEPENFRGGPHRLAQLTGRTPEHISRLLKKHAGITPSELILAERMNHAANQLRFTRTPLGEIADECGYRTQSHFQNAFKQFHGRTPLAYRRLSRF